MPVKERMARLGKAGLLLLMLPMLSGWWFSVVRARYYNEREGNPRLIAHPELRGGFLDRTGRALAHNDGRKRVYPLGRATAPLLGYFDLRVGTSGLEDAYDQQLWGHRQADLMDGTGLTSTRVKGPDVILGLDAGLQELCYKLLAGRRGAIVLLHIPSGEILAAASAPSYDPATLRDRWDELSSSREAPLFHRGLAGLYSPGSTFKVLTLIAALEEGVLGPTSTLTCAGKIPFENFTLRDSSDTAHGQLSVRDAFAYSCNVAFAETGLKLGVNRMNEWMKRTQLLRASVHGSAAGLPAQADGKKLSTAQAAIGQGSLLVSPLGMARLTAAVAREGIDIEPHLYRGLKLNGKVDSTVPPLKKQRVMKQSTASFVARAMRAVVMEGTGGAAALPGVEVAGKTGTAENPRGRPDAWFVGYAPYSNPKFAVAVVVENAGYGGEHAAPLAARALQAALATPLGKR